MDHLQSKIGIVILNWNGKKETISCIESIIKTQDDLFDIIIVDNASSDDSVNAINERFPAIKIIKNLQNLGFAGGMNKGIQYCLKIGYPIVILLNNDTEFLQKSVLKTYRTVLENFREIGVVSARITLDKKGIINQKEFIGDASLLVKLLYKICCPPYKISIRDKKIIFNSLTITNKSMIHGVSIGTRIDVLKEVGFFNSDFFCYEEDRDLFIRIKKAGYKLAVLNDYWIYHKWSKSSSQMSPFKMYYKSRNLWYMRNRYHSKRYIIYAYLRLFGVAFKNNLISYFIRGLKDGVNMKMGNTFE